MDISSKEVLHRIEVALVAAVDAVRPFTAAGFGVERKLNGDPVTEADRAANGVLRELLVRDDEGWLSEETVDDLSRLAKRSVWIVDPLDGTREFVAGIPEWAISVGFVRDGRAIAGGICNPQTGEVFLGSIETGVTYNGEPAKHSSRPDLDGALVLASRSEVKRGEWQRFENRSFRVRPLGSVAYKLALVAAGLADATWTLVPKHEWDIAGGVALIEAAGAVAYSLDGEPLRFNKKNPWLSGLVAHSHALKRAIRAELENGHVVGSCTES